MARITRHARKRFKQRLGVHKTDTNKNANRALRDGVSQRDVRGDISRFMAALYFRNRTCNNIRLYNGMVYVFAKETLITVFPIPYRFREDAAEAQKRKEQSNEENRSSADAIDRTKGKAAQD